MPKIRLASILAAFTLSASAFAGTIVDTGPGALVYSGGYALYSGQWLANEFTITSATTITQVDGWIGGGPGSLHVALWSSQNHSPLASLYSQQVHSIQYSNAWVGANGLAWTLDAGTYFAAFEVMSSDAFNGAMDHGKTSSPTGLPSAFTTGGNWRGSGDLQVGYRVFGDATQTVPEPGSLALAGIALMGVFLNARRRIR